MYKLHLLSKPSQSPEIAADCTFPASVSVCSCVPLRKAWNCCLHIGCFRQGFATPHPVYHRITHSNIPPHSLTITLNYGMHAENIAITQLGSTHPKLLDLIKYSKTKTHFPPNIFKQCYYWGEITGLLSESWYRKASLSNGSH